MPVATKFKMRVGTDPEHMALEFDIDRPTFLAIAQRLGLEDYDLAEGFLWRTGGVCVAAFREGPNDLPPVVEMSALETRKFVPIMLAVDPREVADGITSNPQFLGQFAIDYTRIEATVRREMNAWMGGVARRLGDEMERRSWRAKAEKWWGAKKVELANRLDPRDDD